MKKINLSEVECRILSIENIPEMNKICRKLEILPNQLKLFLEAPQNMGFIAIHQREIIAFIYGFSVISLSKTKPKFFIYSVDVLVEFQNFGVGSKLFKYVVDYTKENGFSECFVITNQANLPACKIYKKAGGESDYEDEIVYVVKHE